MVLSVGIISAFIISKNRLGALTRLQKLSKILKQKPITKKTLYSYPVKKMFLIVLTLTFMAGMQLFVRDCKKQLNQKHGHMQQIPQHKLQLFDLHPKHNPLSLDNTSQPPTNPHTTSQTQTHNQLNRLQNTVNTILLFFLITLILLTKQLNFQRLLIKGRKVGDSEDVNGHIQKQKLSVIFGWRQVQMYLFMKSDQLLIQLCGDDRFTNKNTYYAIRKVVKLYGKRDGQVVDRTGALLDVQIGVKMKQQTLITKGNIYEARQSIIYMSHILQIQPQLSIKNGPFKPTKRNSKVNKKK